MKVLKLCKVRRLVPGTGGYTAAQAVFGERSRYCVREWHGRDGVTSYLVTDAERTDEVTGGPAVIRQTRSLQAALAGLQEE